LKQANLPYQENKSGFVLANNKQIVIKSWSQVLETIRFQLIQDRNQELLSDLDQIIGFCEIVDKDSFLPIQDTDLSPSIPKRVNSYYLLADKVVDELKRIGFANTEKLNATPQKFGYTRYFHLTTGRDAAFYVHFELWEKNADTPFWLRLYDSINGKWCVREQTIKKLKEYAHSKGLTFFETNKREFYLPVYPLQSASEEEVVTNLVSTLQEIFHYVDS
jgi:hypothetical protein